jgi:hypothetical protein
MDEALTFDLLSHYVGKRFFMQGGVWTLPITGR